MKQSASQEGTPKASTASGERNRLRLPYVPPQLNDLGDVRDMILGGSPGQNDSGNFTTEAPPNP